MDSELREIERDTEDPAVRARLYRARARAGERAPRVLRGCWLEKDLSGSGAGARWRALDCATADPVVLRLIPLGGPHSVEQRLREALYLRDALAGPGVLPVLQAEVIHDYEGGPTLCVREPWVPGESLNERSRRGPLPWRDALQVVHALAQVLVRMEDEGVIHGEIQPTQVHLALDGATWLMGWEGAQRAAVTAPVQAMGAPWFLAPEVMSTTVRVIPSDLYALGAVLYHALTATLPFQGATLADVASVILRGPLPDPRHVLDVPDALVHLLHQALAKHPARRPSAARFAAGCAALLQGDPLPPDLQPQGWLRRTLGVLRGR